MSEAVASELCGVVTSVAVTDNQVVIGTARGSVYRYTGEKSSTDFRSCAEPNNWQRVHESLPAITSIEPIEDGYLVLTHQEGLWTNSDGEGLSQQYANQRSPQALLDFLDLSDLENSNLSSGLVVGTRGLFLARDVEGVWRQGDLYIDPEWEEPDDFTLYGVARLSDKTLIAVGEAGVIYWSEDGEDWRKDNAGTESSWFGLEALPNGGVLLYGFGGSLALKEPTGEGWQLAQAGNKKSLFASALLADGTVLLAGAAGELLHWLGPETIRPIAVDTSADISDIVLYQGQLLLATDSGVLSVPLPQ